MQLPLQLTLCASLLLLHMLQPIKTLLATQQNQSQMPHLHLHLHSQVLPQMLMELCLHYCPYALRPHMLLWVVTHSLPRLSHHPQQHVRTQSVRVEMWAEAHQHLREKLTVQVQVQ